jgi:hypothetical protein
VTCQSNSEKSKELLEIWYGIRQITALPLPLDVPELLPNPSRIPGIYEKRGNWCTIVEINHESVGKGLRPESIGTALR